MPEDHESGFKYGALIFSPPEGPSEPHAMHGGKETFIGKITSLVPENELARWREWLGFIAWQRIERADRIVIVRAAATAPTLNDDDKRLRGMAAVSWRAFLLSDASHSLDAPLLISGEAAGGWSGAALLNVKTAQPLDRLIIPAYEASGSFRKLRVDALAKQWAKYGRHDDSWFYRWIEIDGFLSSMSKVPQCLGYALLAHDGARTEPFLEFSIPGCVRAAEGIIAIPRGKGMKDTFCERALRLVPSLRTDEYIGRNAEALLPELYQLRSGCVHGKLPFAALQALGGAGEERAAELAYAADVLARGALLVALRHSDKSIFETREALERAWASGAFPPKA
jgi:hypothetical protein